MYIYLQIKKNRNLPTILKNRYKGSVHLFLVTLQQFLLSENMGFLTAGNTFSWEEASEKPTEFVRKHGIIQFLNIYNKLKDRTRDSLRWGDEVNYLSQKTL